MKTVAEHLYQHALSINTTLHDDAKLFVKTACNRFYYYIYHLIRDEIQKINNNMTLEHGSKGSGQITNSYAKKIREKLKEFNHNTQNFDITVRKLKSIYIDLYDLRETVDYRDIEIKFSNLDIEIWYTSKSKNNKLQKITIQNIKDYISDLDRCIQLFISFRQQAGF